MTPEARLRARVCKWLAAHLPRPGLWTSIEHGRAHHGTPEQRAREWQRLQAQGVKVGIPDVMVWYAGHCIGIELKVGANKPTAGQMEFGAGLVSNGFMWRACYSVEAVALLLHQAGVPITGSALQLAGAYDAELAREAGVKAPKTARTKTPASDRAKLAAIARIRASGVLV